MGLSAAGATLLLYSTLVACSQVEWLTMALSQLPRIDAVWAHQFGITPQTFTIPSSTVLPRAALEERHRIVVFRTAIHALVFVPPSLHERVERLAHAQPHQVLSAVQLQQHLIDVPMDAGTSDAILYLDPSNVHVVDDPHIRPLLPTDSAALSVLQQAATARERELGTIELDHSVVLGWFEQARLLGAGSLIYDGEVADVGVLTHPAARGRGIAQRLVQALAGRGVEQGKLVQYTTMHSNVGSMRVAEASRFERYATEEALRLRTSAGQR